jgi:uncharacterized protein (TIGR02246 family)
VNAWALSDMRSANGAFFCTDNKEDALSRTNLIAIVVLVLESSTVGCVATAEVDRSADEAGIRAMFEELELAANARDGQRTASLYTSEGDIWVAGGPHVIGSARITEFEEQFYANPDYGGWKLTIDAIRFVSRDAAVVETSAITRLSGGDMKDRATVLVVREHRTWKAAAVRIMVVEPV